MAGGDKSTVDTVVEQSPDSRAAGSPHENMQEGAAEILARRAPRRLEEITVTATLAQKASVVNHDSRVQERRCHGALAAPAPSAPSASEVGGIGSADGHVDGKTGQLVGVWRWQRPGTTQQRDGSALQARRCCVGSLPTGDTYWVQRLEGGADSAGRRPGGHQRRGSCRLEGERHAVRSSSAAPCRHDTTSGHDDVTSDESRVRASSLSPATATDD